MKAFIAVHLPLELVHEGKVRASYRIDDERRLIVTTDRISALDRVIGGVPGKGQVLNQLSFWWFEATADVIPNHALSLPDPNALVARHATPLGVEVVVRARLTGSTSTSLLPRYLGGERLLYGHRLPDGLTPHGPLPTPIITPTTKAENGAHDEPITEAELIQRGIVDAAVWDEVAAAALALFDRGREITAAAGLILADTKYEFGLDAHGQVMLIDEMHTPDSSRLWVADSFDERLATGREPESLDKEPVRLALAATGYRGDGPVPKLSDQVWIDTAARYVQAYELITGTRFVPASAPTEERLLSNLSRAGLLSSSL